MFKIGTVSRLLGISMEGLRLYEKKGITHPRRDEQTGYRYYSLLDITALIRSRNYRSLGYTMDQVAELMHAPDVQSVNDSYCAHIALLQRERQLLDMKIEYLQNLSSTLDGIEAKLGQYTLTERPGFYRLEFIDEYGGMIRDNRLFLQWMEYLPFVTVSPAWEYPRSLLENHFAITGLNLDEKYAAFFGVTECAQVKYYPPLPCVMTYAVHKRGESTADFFAPAMRYMQAKGLTPTGEITGHTFLSLDLNELYPRYRQIFIPYC